MNKDDMIQELSDASDRDGHLLVDMLDTYKKTGLKDLTTDQVFQYYKLWKDKKHEQIHNNWKTDSRS